MIHTSFASPAESGTIINVPPPVSFADREAAGRLTSDVLSTVFAFFFGLPRGFLLETGFGVASSSVASTDTTLGVSFFSLTFFVALAFFGVEVLGFPVNRTNPEIRFFRGVVGMSSSSSSSSSSDSWMSSSMAFPSSCPARPNTPRITSPHKISFLQPGQVPLTGMIESVDSRRDPRHVR